MITLVRYGLLPLLCLLLLFYLGAGLLIHFPVVCVSIIIALIGLFGYKRHRWEKLNAKRGWRVCRKGRDEITYEELHNGEWLNINLDGELLVGKPSFILYLSKTHFPEWASNHTDEITKRIKSELRAPKYTYE